MQSKIRKKRNPNLSKYDAPLRIQFDRGFNAFKGKQYVKTNGDAKIIMTENPYNPNTMQAREWLRGYNSAYAQQLKRVKDVEARRRSKKYMQDKIVIEEVMTAEFYEMKAGQTAIFPEHKALEYLALGLTSEAGEVAGKVKKLIRDGEDMEGFELKKIAIASEIGDVLWYCAMMAKEVGVPLNDIMKDNLKKLHGRKVRGTLHGSGDNR